MASVRDRGWHAPRIEVRGELGMVEVPRQTWRQMVPPDLPAHAEHDRRQREKRLRIKGRSKKHK